MKAITTIFLIFLLLTFISGIYFCLTYDISIKEGFDPATDLSGPTTIDCPNMLIKSGNSLLLFNSSLPNIPGTNPLPFYNLDEYINYLENQKNKGIHCPVLFVQEENNTQGQSVFRVRPDVFQPEGGLPTQNTINQLSNTVAPIQNTNPSQFLDASRDHSPWNSNQYNGFDPMGLHIGQYTSLDALHDSTFKGQSLSDNPMDTNWGGILYTKQAVDSGKYKENEVIPPAKDLFKKDSDNIRDQKNASQSNIFA
jgi:hypothetical protein